MDVCERWSSALVGPYDLADEKNVTLVPFSMRMILLCLLRLGNPNL
jgi:hypothetical protein